MHVFIQELNQPFAIVHVSLRKAFPYNYTFDIRAVVWEQCKITDKRAYHGNCFRRQRNCLLPPSCSRVAKIRIFNIAGLCFETSSSYVCLSMAMPSWRQRKLSPCSCCCNWSAARPTDPSLANCHRETLVIKNNYTHTPSKEPSGWWFSVAVEMLRPRCQTNFDFLPLWYSGTTYTLKLFYRFG